MDGSPEQQPKQEKYAVGGRLLVGLLLLALGINGAIRSSDDVPFLLIGIALAGAGLYQVVTAAIISGNRRA